MNQILTCGTHRQPALFLLIKQYSQSTILKCPECIIQGQLSGKDLILITDIFKQDQSIGSLSNLSLEDSIVKRIEYMKEHVTEDTFENQRKDIIDFFSQFLDEVCYKIKQLEKNQLRQVDFFYEKFMQFQKQANMPTYKENLQRILSSNFQSINQIENEIRKYFDSIKEDKSKNQSLETTLKEIEQSGLFFDLAKLKNIKDEVLKCIETSNTHADQENEPKIKFEKSTFQKSSQAIISYLENKNISIETPKEGRIIAYTNFNLDKNLKYLIQVDVLNNTKKGFQLIGLIPEQLKDSQEIYQANLTFSNFSVCGLSKKIRGECFTKTLKTATSFKLQIRICLSEKTFIVCDYPNNSSVYALPENSISDDQQYRLGVGLYYARDHIIFEQFEVVSSFPEIY